MARVKKVDPINEMACGVCNTDCNSCSPRRSGAHWSRCFSALTMGLFFLALSILAFQQVFGNHWFENIKAEVTSQPYARTITVTGEGKITAKPDLGRITLSVVSNGETVDEVTTDNNKKMTDVVAVVKKLGVDEKDVKTSGYNLYPQYDYSRPTTAVSETPRILGYRLTQSLEVKVRDLDLVDQVLDQSIAAGANQVGQLSFEVDDDGALKQQARDEAFDAAREKAQKMASAAGVKVGRVVTFSEGFDGNLPVYPNFALDGMAYREMAVAESAPIEVGTQELAINVSVTYEID